GWPCPLNFQPHSRTSSTRFTGCQCPKRNAMVPFYMKDGSFSGSDDSMYYLLAGDGLYLTRRSKFFTTELRVQGLPWLENHGERVQLHLPRPLPDSVLEQAVAFFVAVFERFGSEAILLLYYACDGD